MNLLPRSVVTFAFISLSAFAQEPTNVVIPAAHDDWRFAHPDATLIGSVNLSKLLNSPLIEQILPNEPKAALPLVREMVRGINNIQFSLEDNGSPNPDVLLLIHGNVPQQQLPMGQIRKIGDNLFLAGNTDALDKAVTRMMMPDATLKSRLIAHTDDLVASDFWIAGSLPPTLTAATPGLKLDIRALALGLTFKDGLDFDLSVETNTPAQAAELVKTAYEAEAQQPAQFKGLLMTSVNGSIAHFRSHVPEATLAEAVRTGMKAAANASSNAAPPFVPAAPPKPKRITISGLDDGPREIILPPATSPATH